MKLVTCPLVFVNEPAIFCASLTTFAMPKSSSFTVQSPRGSPRTKTLPGLTSRWAIPLRCASASASAAGSSRWTISAIVRSGSAARLLVGDHGLERRALEPLEDHVGDVLALRRRRASRCRAPGRWRRVRAERSASSAPSWTNSSRSFCAVLLREVAERLEDLERHGALPDDVHRPVHGREAALADDALDGVLVGDRATDELKRVVTRPRGLLATCDRDDTRGLTCEAKRAVSDA